MKRIRSAFVRLYDADPAKLDRLAAATHTRAIQGNVAAATFIRDTLDGKPAQQIEVQGDGLLEQFKAWFAWTMMPEVATQHERDMVDITPQVQALSDGTSDVQSDSQVASAGNGVGGVGDLEPHPAKLHRDHEVNHG